MLIQLRNAFITGLLVILPLGVTVFIINFLLDRVGAPASRVFFGFVETGPRGLSLDSIPFRIVSTLIVLALITLLGWASRFFVTKFFLNKFEELLDRLPFINSIYRTVKQIVDTFGKQEKAVFQEVVMIEYPRHGCYALGFLTSRAKGETQARTGEAIINVFVPTTPNPTSGFLLLIPEEQITRLDMTITDGMKLIISGGAVVPPWDESQAVKIVNPTAATGEARPPEQAGQS